MEREVEVLLQATDVQAVLQFNRYVLVNKINHLLRGLPPDQSKPLRDLFSSLQRRLWEKVCGLRPRAGDGHDLSFSIAQLSVKHGLGLGNADDMANAAYAASFTSAIPILSRAYILLQATDVQAVLQFSRLSLTRLQLSRPHFSLPLTCNQELRPRLDILAKGRLQK